MPHRGSPKYASHILGVRVTVADETRVRTKKTGRIGHEAVAEATYVFDRSRAQSPEASKKKASSKKRVQTIKRNPIALSPLSKKKGLPHPPKKNMGNKINIVFDEIFTNIVSYSKATLATVSYSIEGGKLHISFTDNGIPYNPLETAEPDITLSADERAIGGLGIFMVKKMTESMEYEYKDDKNILTLVIALS